MALKQITDELLVDPSRVISIHQTPSGETMINVDCGSYTANYKVSLTPTEVQEKLRNRAV